MNILILGSGGREHTFAWKIAQSPLCKNLYIAPGNAGTEQVGINLPVNPANFEAVKKITLLYDINLVLVGPEAPLVAGIYDFFKNDSDLSDIPLIGPSQQGAQLEGSKAFAKEFMAKRNIPTAGYRAFTTNNLQEGLDYIDQLAPPVVLKADGLAAGKGVLILENLEAAKTELQAMLSGKFGTASTRVVIEDFLEGIEFSVFVITDGKAYQLLPVAKDYKRIGEKDTGLNTGGMGAVSPPPFVTDEVMQKVEERIIQPTIRGIQEEGLDYQGFIFFGLILVKGDPFVIEYNCRMGDPETEVVLPRLQNDLLELLLAIPEGTLSKHTIQINQKAASTIMLVSGGYPEAYQKGKVISGLEEVEGSTVFHAGTRQENGVVLTNGGRVMAITSMGNNFREALTVSYKNAKKINFEAKNYRKDIGFDL